MITSTQLQKETLKKSIKKNIPDYWSKKVRKMFIENTLNFYELLDEIEYEKRNEK